MKLSDTIKHTVLMGVVLFAFTNIAKADDAADRLAAAIEYEKAVPTSESVKIGLNALANNPDSKFSKDDIKATIFGINTSGDMDKIKQANIEALAKNFTVNELKAMTEFYGSPEGKSAQQKMPLYVQGFFPEMNKAIMKAISGVNNGKAEGFGLKDLKFDDSERTNKN